MHKTTHKNNVMFYSDHLPRRLTGAAAASGGADGGLGMEAGRDGGGSGGGGGSTGFGKSWRCRAPEGGAVWGRAALLETAMAAGGAKRVLASRAPAKGGGCNHGSGGATSESHRFAS